SMFGFKCPNGTRSRVWLVLVTSRIKTSNSWYVQYPLESRSQDADQSQVWSAVLIQSPESHFKVWVRDQGMGSQVTLESDTVLQSIVLGSMFGVRVWVRVRVGSQS
uniref:Uncharacterized protein n=1 Tax=Cannabis sativa TaxID=3483 RepID=A0A803QRY2_CANSA